MTSSSYLRESRTSENSLERINPLGAMAGFVIGSVTRLGIGEKAYRLPGGAAGGSLIFCMGKYTFRNVSLNMTNTVIGHYAGVFVTDYLLKQFGVDL